jgi:uncharacterized alkaline shock family protein YloU
VAREESRNDLGIIKIHKNVIASIAALAAQEIEGVKRVGGNFTSGILNLIGNKNLYSVKVEFSNSNDEVKVDLPLVIKYDYNVADVAAKVQENVRTALEKMTNLYIKDINIRIQSVERG